MDMSEQDITENIIWKNHFARDREKKEEKTTLHHVKLVKHVNITELWHSYCGKE